MNTSTILSATELEAYLAALEAHPFAALLLTVIAIAVVRAYSGPRRSNPNTAPRACKRK